MAEVVQNSADIQLVHVTYSEVSGITMLTLVRQPVNALNLEFMQQIVKALRETLQRGSRGLIITSATRGVFSSGVDITEMYKPNVERCTRFWKALQDLWLMLYGLEIPVAVAINGSSLGAGCLIALCCEYRVMVKRDDTVIGFNAPMLGLTLPKWIRNTLISTIGYRKAEDALITGKLFKPSEALHVGLIDSLAASSNQAIMKCEDYINDNNKFPLGARNAMKLQLREDALLELMENREKDVETFVTSIMRESTQKDIEKYFQGLKIKPKK